MKQKNNKTVASSPRMTFLGGLPYSDPLPTHAPHIPTHTPTPPHTFTQIKEQTNLDH